MKVMKNSITLIVVVSGQKSNYPEEFIDKLFTVFVIYIFMYVLLN